MKSVCSLERLPLAAAHACSHRGAACRAARPQALGVRSRRSRAAGRLRCRAAAVPADAPCAQHPDIAEVLVTEAQLRERVTELGQQLAVDYADRAPLVVGTLKGAVVFMADLVRAMQPLPDGMHLEFLRASSYGLGATERRGSVTVCATAPTKASGLAVAGRHVLLVRFAVGYGLDFDERFRSLPYVGVLRPECYATAQSGSEHLILNCPISDGVLVSLSLHCILKACVHAVTASATRLQLWEVDEQGLELIAEQEVFGAIRSLAPLRQEGAPDALAVLLESGTISLLRLDASLLRFLPLAQLPAWPPEQTLGPDGDPCLQLAVDGTGRAAAACLRDRLVLLELPGRGAAAANGSGSARATWQREGEVIRGLAFLPLPAPQHELPVQQQEAPVLAVLLRERGQWPQPRAPSRLLLLQRRRRRRLRVPYLAAACELPLPTLPPPAPPGERGPSPAGDAEQPRAVLPGPPGSRSVLVAYPFCLVQLFPDLLAGRPEPQAEAGLAAAAAAQRPDLPSRRPERQAGGLAAALRRPPRRHHRQDSLELMDWEGGEEGEAAAAEGGEEDQWWEAEAEMLSDEHRELGLDVDSAAAAAAAAAVAAMPPGAPAAWARELAALPCAAALLLPAPVAAAAAEQEQGAAAAGAAGAPAWAPGRQAVAASDLLHSICSWCWESPAAASADAEALPEAEQVPALLLGCEDGMLFRALALPAAPPAWLGQQRELQPEQQEQKEGAAQQAGGMEVQEPGEPAPAAPLLLAVRPPAEVCGSWAPSAAAGLAALPGGRLLWCSDEHTGQGAALLQLDAGGRYQPCGGPPAQDAGSAAAPSSDGAASGCGAAHIPSTGPVADCLLADLEGLQQNQVYLACSGGGSGGTAAAAAAGGEFGPGGGGRLCVLYPDPHPEAVLEVPGAAEGLTGLWGLKMDARDPHHSLVLLSHVGGSRLLAVQGGTFRDATEAAGIRPWQQTLAAGSCCGCWGAQVTSAEVLLFPTAAAAAVAAPAGAGAGALAAQPAVAWRPPPGASISAAAVSEGAVLLQLSGSRQLIVLLAAPEAGAGAPESGEPGALGGSARLVQAAALPLQVEVSCFSNLLPQARAGAPAASAALLAVGTYGPSVLLLRLVWDAAAARGSLVPLQQVGADLLSSACGSDSEDEQPHTDAAAEGGSELMQQLGRLSPRAASIQTPAPPPSPRQLLSPRQQQRQQWEQRTPESVLLLPPGGGEAGATGEGSTAGVASLLVLKAAPLLLQAGSVGSGGSGHRAEAPHAAAGGARGGRPGGHPHPSPEQPQLFLLCASSDGCLRMVSLARQGLAASRALPLGSLAPARLALHAGSATLAVAGTRREPDELLLAGGMAGAQPLLLETAELALVDPESGEVLASYANFLPQERITALVAWDALTLPPPTRWASRAESAPPALPAAAAAAAAAGAGGVGEGAEEEEAATAMSLRSHPIALGSPLAAPAGQAGAAPTQQAQAQAQAQESRPEWRRLGAYLAVGTSVGRGNWRDEGGTSLAGRILVLQVLSSSGGSADGSPAAGEQGGGGSPAHALEQEREQQEQAPAAWGQLRLEPVCDARLPGRVLALCTGPATAPCPDSTGASSSARASPSAAAGGSDGSAADGSGGRASRLFASVGRRLVSYGLARYGQLRRMHWTPTGRVITYLRAAPSGMLVASDGRDGVTLYSYSEPSERLPQSRPPLARIWHHREGEPNAPLHLGHHPAWEGPAQQQQRHLFGAAPPLPPPPGVQAPPPAFAVVAADAERCAAVGAAALPPRVAAAADGDGDGGEGQAAVVADAGGLVRVVQQRYLQHEAALASIYRFGLGECVAALLPGSLRFGCTGGGGRRGAAAGTSAVVVTTAGGVVELSPLPQHRAQQLLRLQQALVERTEAPAGAGAAQPAAAPAGSHAAFRQTELPQPFQHPPPPQATPCEVMEEESEAEVEEGEATGGTPAAMEAEEGTGHSERGGGGGPHTPPGVLASEAAGEPPSTPEALRRLAAAEAAAAAWAQAEAGAQPVQAILDGDLLRLFLLQPPAQQEQLLAAAAEGPGGGAWEPPADAEQQRADCVWIQQRLSSLLH
eukprot:scaffold28.g7546.t1